MTKSKAEQYLNGKKNLPPPITPNMVKNVSQYRREQLAKEVEQGFFRDGTSNHINKSGIPAPSYSVGMAKNAQVLSSTNPASSFRGPGDTVRQTPEVYSPLWLNSNLNLPRDRATINAWCRSFYALQPWVQNAINLHSTYPISKLGIKSSNKKVENFFNEMIENIDLMNICVQVAQEYWLLGEAFVYAELDERKAMWSRLVIQNPDYIVIKRSVIASEPLIMMRPDENLRRIVFSNRPADIEQRRQLNETIVDHIKRGENIPLDNFYVSHLARKISPYEVRGTGLPVCCFRQLMLIDQLREAKFAQASNMINPLTLVKVGNDGVDGLHPTTADLEAFREALENAQYDRDFKLITHPGVSIEKIGSAQGIYDTSGDITQLLKECYMGLMVPQIVLEGGGDITYANGGISLDILRQRYMQFRNMMSAWLKKKIFAPIAKINEFYDYEDGEKKLVIPEIDWNHMSLFDTSDYVNVLVQLSGDQKKVSHHTLYRSLGLDYEDERMKMRREAISESIHKKELLSLDRLPLTELRGMNEDSEIKDAVEPVNPNESPYTASSGTTPDMTGGTAGLSLPPLPGASVPTAPLPTPPIPAPATPPA